MTRLTMSLCALVAAASAACTGTDVGNPTVDVDFALLQTQSPHAVATAWLAVDRVRLRSSAACDGTAEREFEGPFAVDLLAPGPTEALAGLDVPAGGYCRFEVKWNAFSAEALPPGAPPELAEASIAITGVRGDGTAFVVRSARDDELRLDAVAGEFTIDDATTALFVGLDNARLFTGVDLDAAVIDPDGTIYIDGENNTELLDAFDLNLRDAASLFDDDDANGELDADESEAADALAN